jgi:hypothetical protein
MGILTIWVDTQKPIEHFARRVNDMRGLRFACKEHGITRNNIKDLKIEDLGSDKENKRYTTKFTIETTVCMTLEEKGIHDILCEAFPEGDIRAQAIRDCTAVVKGAAWLSAEETVELIVEGLDSMLEGSNGEELVSFKESIDTVLEHSSSDKLKELVCKIHFRLKMRALQSQNSEEMSWPSTEEITSYQDTDLIKKIASRDGGYA